MIPDYYVKEAFKKKLMKNVRVMDGYFESNHQCCAEKVMTHYD